MAKSHATDVVCLWLIFSTGSRLLKVYRNIMHYTSLLALQESSTMWGHRSILKMSLVIIQQIPHKKRPKTNNETVPLRRTVSVSKAWFLCAKELYCCQKKLLKTQWPSVAQMNQALTTQSIFVSRITSLSVLVCSWEFLTIKNIKHHMFRMGGGGVGGGSIVSFSPWIQNGQEVHFGRRENVLKMAFLTCLPQPLISIPTFPFLL